MDLTTIDKSFGELDIETRVALFRHFQEGGGIQSCEPDGWVIVARPAWFNESTYRTVATPDSIDWDAIKPEFDYMARDESGEAWVYDCKPNVGADGYGFSGTNCVRVDNLLSSYRRGTFPWEKSLVIRPGAPALED